MPSYVCYAQPGVLTPAQQGELAQRITRHHSRTTGAPTSFVQVVFRRFEAAGHYIGGRPADSRSVWVYGLIRAGRTDDMKNRLLMGIRDHVREVAGVSEDLVWVYLTELAPTDMVEFGHVLPAAGQEQAWFDALPADLREKLMDPEVPSRGFTL
jgi:phenylpyruvate tautomerase PptA (4-oxalocrotonate tautomerase family)